MPRKTKPRLFSMSRKRGPKLLTPEEVKGLGGPLAQSMIRDLVGVDYLYEYDDDYGEDRKIPNTRHAVWEHDDSENNQVTRQTYIETLIDYNLRAAQDDTAWYRNYIRKRGGGLARLKNMNTRYSPPRKRTVYANKIARIEKLIK